MKSGGPIKGLAPKLMEKPAAKVKTGLAVADAMSPVVSKEGLPGTLLGLKKDTTNKLNRGADINSTVANIKDDLGYKLSDSFVMAAGSRTKSGNESVRELHKITEPDAIIPGVFETYSENDPSKKTIVAMTKDGRKIVSPSMSYLEKQSTDQLKRLRGKSATKMARTRIKDLDRYEKALRTGMADGGEAALEEKPNPMLKSGALISAGTDMLAGSLEGMKGEVDTGGRMSPAAQMKKNANLAGAQNAVSNVGKGVAAGAALGPVGMLVGGGVGLLTSGISAIINKSKNEAEMKDAISEWSSGHASNYASNLSRTGFKDGGKIKGKGSAKSDDIPMDVPDGSFIVPAENAALAMELGRSYLGWDSDEKAMKNGGSVKIKASNGEVMFSPAEVGVLKYYGVDLDSMAPNADGSKKMAAGGFAEEEPAEEVETEKKEKKKPDWDTFMKNAPEFLGALQMAGGTAGLIAAGKKPDRTISHTLRALSSETRRLSEYGYEPKVINALNTSIERARTDYNRMVVGRGGSAMEIQKQLEQGLISTIGEKAKLSYADAAEKARKYTQYMQVQSQIAGQEFDINRLNIEDWYKNQEAYAEMLGAGISNIIGGRQLKSQQDAMKDIAKEGTVNITV